MGCGSSTETSDKSIKPNTTHAGGSTKPVAAKAAVSGNSKLQYLGEEHNLCLS